MFRSFQINIRGFRRSLLKLLHIHDLVRFCKQGVVGSILQQYTQDNYNNTHKTTTTIHTRQLQQYT